MSTIKVNSIEPANAGSEDYFLARAWVNFNGTGTVAIRDSGNVSSITDNGSGNYTVNFSAALASANYASLAVGSGPTNGGVGIYHVNKAGGVTVNSAPTSSSFRFFNCNYNAVLYDAEYNNVGVSQ
jgi:hypothetical protein